MPPFVTYALLAACAAAFGFTFFLETERGAKRWPKLKRFALVIQLASMAAAYFTLRPGRGVDAQQAMRSAATAQRPLLLEVYSNY